MGTAFMTSRKIAVVCSCLLVCFSGRVCDAQPAIAIENATIYTMGKAGRIESATIVMRGNQIEAIGTDVTVPPDAELVDGSGKVIMPGIIDPYRVVTIAGSAAQPEFRTVVIQGRTFRVPNRTSTSTGSFTRVADNFYPYGQNFQSWLRQGVTVTNLVTRGQGQAALANVLPADRAKMIFQGDGILFAALTNQTTSLDIVRKPLDGATRGATAGRGTAASSGGRGVPSGRGAPSGRGGSSSSRSTSANAALWKEVKEGKKPLMVNVNNAATVLHLKKVLDKHTKVRVLLVIAGGPLYETADSLPKDRVSLILAPTLDYVPNTQRYYCPARLAHEKKLPFSIAMSLDSNVASTSDDPLLGLAFLIKSGVPEQAILESLTTRPAKFLGIEKTHGSLESKKRANFLVFSGHPFDRGSMLEQTWIEGKLVSDLTGEERNHDGE